MRLVQLQHNNKRAIAIVAEPGLRVIAGATSIVGLAQEAVGGGTTLAEMAPSRATGPVLDYDPIYSGSSEWQILPPIDHPEEPSRCLVPGRGLTHLGSAASRQRMHEVRESDLTDVNRALQAVKGRRWPSPVTGRRCEPRLRRRPATRRPRPSL